jgi:hypothetical protein
MRVQRTRSSPSALRSALTRHPLGAVKVISAIAVLIHGATAANAQQPPDYVRAHRFEDYPIPVEKVSPPAQPDVSSSDAHLFRTQLRRAARQPVNFAGHLRVAAWGCGTCCQGFGIVDLKNGQVFMPGFVVGCGCPMDRPPCEGAGIYSRKDSALLILIGIGPKESTCGVYYYLWKAGTLEYLGAEDEIKSECGA